MESELFYCKRNRKLTENEVMFVRNSTLSLRKLGFFFNVSHKTIHYWKNELNRKAGSLRSIESSRQSRKNRKAKKEKLERFKLLGLMY